MAKYAEHNECHSSTPNLLSLLDVVRIKIGNYDLFQPDLPIRAVSKDVSNKACFSSHQSGRSSRIASLGYPDLFRIPEGKVWALSCANRLTLECSNLTASLC